MSALFGLFLLLCSINWMKSSRWSPRTSHEALDYNVITNATWLVHDLHETWWKQLYPSGSILLLRKVAVTWLQFRKASHPVAWIWPPRTMRARRANQKEPPLAHVSSGNAFSHQRVTTPTIRSAIAFSCGGTFCSTMPHLHR